MRLIDADALIDKYGDWYTEEGTEEGYIGTIKGIVDSMPTIEPERKKGKWKMVLTRDAIGFNTVRFCCSECNGMDYGTPPFCRMCGAEMEGAEPEDIPMEYFESGGK